MSTTAVKPVTIIPPFDVSEQYREIGSAINGAALEILASGRYIGGPPVAGFEAAFADYIGSSECIACNSGTDALYLGLRALKIGSGDEVITTPFTFIATAEVITAVGATPVFVDIDPQTFNLDLDQVAAAVTERTRAIIPVHLFGHPVDMTSLMAIAEAHQLAVIEDCAQATGALWNNRRVGSIGHIGCFSFYPTKNLGACGDGGAITTDDPAIAAAIRKLRDHGRESGYYYEMLGVNSRLDAVQAAILQIKLKHLDRWNTQRRAIAQRYDQLLSPLTNLVLPGKPVGGESVWNQYTIRVSSANGTAENRDALKQHLQENQVLSMIYYPLPLHLQPVYHHLGYGPGSFPVTERAAQEVLSLPMFPELSQAQQDQVIYGLKDFLS